MENALPGTQVSKEFTISATKTDVDINYVVYLKVDSSNFYELNDLVASLETLQGTNTKPAEEDQIVPKSGSHELGTGTIKSTDLTHKYRFTIRFREMGSDQNSNQGRSFVGHLEVTTNGGEGGSLYYNSANPSGTVDQPSSDEGISKTVE